LSEIEDSLFDNYLELCEVTHFGEEMPLFVSHRKGMDIEMPGGQEDVIII
jgi:hypothetical protein